MRYCVCVRRGRGGGCRAVGGRGVEEMEEESGVVCGR